MFFHKKERIGKHAKKIDKLVTGLIIWWAVASVIGFSRKKKNQDIAKKVANKSIDIAKKTTTHVAQKSYSIFWKCFVWILRIFTPKK